MAASKGTQGISHGGHSAEEKFRELTGANKTARAGDGDAILGGVNIEVKQASAATLNQVRPVKYIPLVAYHEPTDSWYVVPAHSVVALASSKTRGQHTENPFESVTLNVNMLEEYRVSAESDLKSRTLKAIKDAEKYPELKESMNKVLRDSKSLAAKSVQDVRTILTKLGLVSI